MHHLFIHPRPEGLLVPFSAPGLLLHRALGLLLLEVRGFHTLDGEVCVFVRLQSDLLWVQGRSCEVYVEHVSYDCQTVSLRGCNRHGFI